MIGKTCKKCGKVFRVYPHRKDSALYCSKACACSDIKPQWRGGRITKFNGYAMIHTERGYVYEHRLAMENYLGRKLASDEIVHHVDGDRQNNQIENLELMLKKEHDRIETTLRWRDRPETFPQSKEVMPNETR